MLEYTSYVEDECTACYGIGQVTQEYSRHLLGLTGLL